MVGNVRTRLSRLEQAVRSPPRIVVIQEWEEGEGDALADHMEAAGEIARDDMVVLVRKFGARERVAQMRQSGEIGPYDQVVILRCF